MTEIGYIKGLVVGQYGEPLSLTIVNKLGVAVPVSEYSGILITLRDPHDLKTLSYAGQFVSDGSDGRVKFTPGSGDIDRDGTWTGQVTFTKSGAQALSQTFKLIVERNLG
jgi:hypothetical protein